MARNLEPRGPDGSGFTATLVLLAVAALIIIVGLVAFPAGNEPTETTAANQEGSVTPNTPPPVRGE